MRFFATTAKGMEPLLADELREMGARAVEPGRSGVAFEGTLETAYRACLWSRIANRILLPLKSFPAPTPEKLYGGVKSVRWSDHLDASRTLAVDFSSSRSQIAHTQFGALKVKDAVVDQCRSVQGTRPSVDVRRPDVRINVYLHEDEATVSVDLSGDSLHKRAYREPGAPAPLKENLAAAILAIARWKAIAEQGGALIDPMCGSGTLPIEAAWIAARRAPGLQRDFFGFLGWKGHEPDLWTRLLEEARDLEIRDSRKVAPVFGFDQDFRAVRLALSNVERTGMRGRVHIEKRELADTQPPRTYAMQPPLGIVAVNPPYGERLGEVEELVPLYRSLGDVLKQRFSGWKAFVLTGSPELAKSVGLRASRRHVLFNGPIECRLLEYEMYAGSR